MTGTSFQMVKDFKDGACCRIASMSTVTAGDFAVLDEAPRSSAMGESVKMVRRGSSLSDEAFGWAVTPRAGLRSEWRDETA